MRKNGRTSAGPKHLATLPLLGRFGILAVLWLVLSWLIAGSILTSNTSELIGKEALALDKLVGNNAKAIGLGLKNLHGIPELVAKDEKIAHALSAHGVPAVSSLSVAQRRAIWTQDLLLRDIDAYLGRVGSALGADVVWVTNGAGDCVASSNAGKPESFVGTNYADRDYFRIARTGKPGRQYAMGRVTNIPGLFFSAPIVIDGRFAGVAVAKIDLPKLAHWVNQTDAFIADERGVIIIAQDPALEMRSIPGASIMGLSEAERQARYKRADFPELAIGPWEKAGLPALKQFDQDGRPLLISGESIPDETLEIHAFRHLPEVAAFDAERLKLFLLICTAGTLALSVIAGLVFFVRIRKHSEAQAAQSASLLRAAIESTADGILVIDAEERIAMCNQRFADIWRMPPELLAGGRGAELQDYVRDQLLNPQLFAETMSRLSGHPELPSFDTLHQKNGAMIERYSFPQRLGEQIVGRVWSFRDVTHKTEVDRMKSEFLATAAHELRTPMTCIFGYAELLLTQEFADEARLELLGIIHSQSKVMISIINELLDLVRIDERQGKDLEISRIEAGALLREVIASCIVPEGRNAPSAPVQGDPRWVRADPMKLMQAVRNVLSNAYKYSPGGGSVLVELVDAGDAEHSGQLGIRISDSGIGMTPEQLARVGERFYRADTSGKISGTGLGMSIVEEIVELLGGSVTIVSEAGAGTAVTLWIPAA